MERSAVVGKNRYTTLGQGYKGWNVTTFSVNGSARKGYQTHTFAAKRTLTLAEAKKEFTRQKRKFKQR